MEFSQLLHVTTRKAWRTWLAAHHDSAADVWLVFYNKRSGKPRVAYNDAVEEALCYGWIDSTVKKVDADAFAQRFTPRRPRSFLSEMNRERVRRMIASGAMTPHGLAKIDHHLSKKTRAPKRFVPPADILAALKADPLVWKHYKKFPKHYQHIRVAWIDGARKRPAVFARRLSYFIRMTRQNKKFGMVQ